MYHICIIRCIYIYIYQSSSILRITFSWHLHHFSNKSFNCSIPEHVGHFVQRNHARSMPEQCFIVPRAGKGGNNNILDTPSGVNCLHSSPSSRCVKHMRWKKRWHSRFSPNSESSGEISVDERANQSELNGGYRLAITFRGEPSLPLPLSCHEQTFQSA